MQRATIGVRTHSGWAALVAVSIRDDAVEVLARRRITLILPNAVGAKQPYHYSENLPIADAEKFLRECATASERLAARAIRELLDELRDRQYSVAACALLLAAGRELPPLEKILASHALIHAAEGEFFRQAITNACKRLDVPVTGMRERDLEDHLRRACVTNSARIEQQISALGKSLGPPWTQDQKAATTAAFAVLMNPARVRSHVQTAS
jgi:hypothetical protein